MELAENKSSGILMKKDMDEKPKRKLTCEVSVFRMNVSGYQKLRNTKKEKFQQSRRILISGIHSICRT